MARRRFTTAEAAVLARKLRAQVPAHELARGMNVELEHGRRSPKTDVTHDDPIKTAKIALAHLNERPDYYDRLEEAEKARSNPLRSRLRGMKVEDVTAALWAAGARGASFDERYEIAMSYSKDDLVDALTSGDANADPAGAREALKSELAEYVVEKAEDSRPRSNPTNRATKLRRLERATSPTQSLRAKRARHYGGVGYFANEREIVQRFPLSSKVLVRYGKTTGEPLYDERVWTVESYGLKGPTSWRDYTDSVKSRLGTSLAILKVSRASSARRNPMVRENPHHYSLRGRVITFDNGNSYHINEASVREAAHYLAHTVKIAEHEGRRIPKGPHGLTPGAAAVLIHFGRKLLRKKRRVAPKRKVAKRIVRRRAAPRKPAPKRTAVRRAAPRPRPAPAPAPARRAGPVDFWDRTAEIYGGAR